MGLVALVWFFDLLGLGIRDLLTKQEIALAYYVLGVTLLITYVFARIEWAQREEEYARMGKKKK
jgi:hypothetical protein